MERLHRDFATPPAIDPGAQVEPGRWRIVIKATQNYDTPNCVQPARSSRQPTACDRGCDWTSTTAWTATTSGRDLRGTHVYFPSGTAGALNDRSGHLLSAAPPRPRWMEERTDLPCQQPHPDAAWFAPDKDETGAEDETATAYRGGCGTARSNCAAVARWNWTAANTASATTISGSGAGSGWSHCRVRISGDSSRRWTGNAGGGPHDPSASIGRCIHGRESSPPPWSVALDPGRKVLPELAAATIRHVMGRSAMTRHLDPDRRRPAPPLPGFDPREIDLTSDICRWWRARPRDRQGPADQQGLGTADANRFAQLSSGSPSRGAHHPTVRPGVEDSDISRLAPG